VRRWPTDPGHGLFDLSEALDRLPASVHVYLVQRGGPVLMRTTTRGTSQPSARSLSSKRTNYIGPPLFTKEGPAYYGAAYHHNHYFSKGYPYKTKLSHHDESQFRYWVHQKHVPFDPNHWPQDYDMRGYWLHVIKPGGVWGGGHFPDTYKTPYDTSFSHESKYAKPGTPFYWHGNLLIDERNNHIIFGPPGAGT
jgi:hypothetical protein